MTTAYLVRLGLSAVLTSSGNGKPRTLKVTVASIRTGTSADLKALDVSGAPAGAVPQYATVSVTNLGPAATSRRVTRTHRPRRWPQARASTPA